MHQKILDDVIDELCNYLKTQLTGLETLTPELIKLGGVGGVEGFEGFEPGAIEDEDAGGAGASESKDGR